MPCAAGLREAFGGDGAYRGGGDASTSRRCAGWPGSGPRPGAGWSSRRRGGAKKAPPPTVILTASPLGQPSDRRFHDDLAART